MKLKFLLRRGDPGKSGIRNTAARDRSKRVFLLRFLSSHTAAGHEGPRTDLSGWQGTGGEWKMKNRGRGAPG